MDPSTSCGGGAAGAPVHDVDDPTPPHALVPPRAPVPAAEEAVACSICMEEYTAASFARQARSLPCGHSLCTGCVRRLQAHCGGDAVVCPMCRARHALGLVGELPRNTALEAASDRLYASTTVAAVAAPPGARAAAAPPPPPPPLPPAPTTTRRLYAMIAARVHLAQAPLALSRLVSEVAGAVAWPPSDFTAAWRAWFGGKTQTVADVRAPTAVFLRALVIAYGSEPGEVSAVLDALPAGAGAGAGAGTGAGGSGCAAARSSRACALHRFSAALHLERSPRTGRLCVCNGTSPRCAAPRDRLATLRARTAEARHIVAVADAARAAAGGGVDVDDGGDDDSADDEGGAGGSGGAGGWRGDCAHSRRRLYSAMWPMWGALPESCYRS